MEEKANTNETVENTEKTEKKKKSLGELMEEHPHTTFWTRFALWVLFACALPFAFLVWRFDLFKGKETRLSLGGWGIFAVIIFAVFIIALISYVKQGVKVKSPFVAQCITGVCRIIVPLVALIVICKVLQNELEMFLQFLIATTMSELVAIPLNPMPEWVAECQKDVAAEERKSTIDYLVSKLSIKKKEK